MQELRLVAVSEDGSYAILEVPGRSGRFLLPVDDRLRTVANGQFSRLAQYEIEVENPLRPKEIQDRIRAGETAEEIADSAGIPPDRVRRFEGPVLAERQYRAQEAQRATIRGFGEGPGPRLGDIVAERLSHVGATSETEWDSRKRPDGNWQVQLQFSISGRPAVAEWIYDPRRRHVIPDDEQATRLCLPADEWAAATLANRTANTATVTPIGSRQHVAHAELARDTDRRISPASVRTREVAFQSIPVAKADQVGTSNPARQPEVPAASAASAVGAAGAAGTAAAGEPPAPERPVKKGRPRRSSVPSWDEIMFGTSRPTD